MRIGAHKFDRGELAGSLADMGTLIPIMVGLIVICGLNATSVLLIIGLAYIMAGLYYRLPIPVQPLKAMGALAIGMGLSGATISAGAIWMGAILLILSCFNLLDFLSKLFTKPIIRGIQFGLGLILMKKALEFMAGDGLNGILIGLSGLAIILLLGSNKRFPASLAVILLGLLVAPFLQSVNRVNLDISAQIPRVAFPAWEQFPLALVLLVIPQLPLTLGNAIMATRETADQYFKEKAKRVTPRALSRTMGLANILAGFLGGMPICHGSGGLTAHYRFGARTGGANLIIGSFFLAGALFFTRPALIFFSLLPLSLLGVLLFWVGLQHSRLISDLKERTDVSLAILIGAVSILTSNLALGFATGILLRYLVLAFQSLRARRSLAPLPFPARELHSLTKEELHNRVWSRSGPGMR